MCGIAGLIKRDSQQKLESLVHAMADALAHRGPDDSNYWVDPVTGVALAHRRLAILDISMAGRQPMMSACGRYLIVFNGEIYNWPDLRSDLETAGQAPTWRGHSDTEVLLACVAAWGLEKTLTRSRGMFALGLWDRAQGVLTLARDRIGQKPLYYGRIGGAFAFASELKALRVLPDASFDADPSAVALMLRYGYIPAPHSIYHNIFKLSPGTLLRVNSDGSFDKPKPWWRFASMVEESASNRLELSDDEALDQLQGVLGEAVREQMIADVPLGALLSGGVDSSTIVALMQAQNARPVQTYTIGFAENEYDESTYAKKVAHHLGTKHTELLVTADEACQIIPRLPDIYDEPFADSSQIPMTLVCMLTKQHVTVCLSGDGGDELFAGYNRYIWAPQLWQHISRLPLGLRRTLASGLQSLPANAWNGIFGAVSSLLPSRLRVSNPGDKLHKLGEVMTVTSKDVLYRELVSQWHGALPLRGVKEPLTPVAAYDSWPVALGFEQQMMAVDTLSYLPDDILVKLDRAAMAASLETRLPFLDERVIDFAWRLPFRKKVRDGQGKWLLRKLLCRHVPRELVDRPKQGFGIPLDHWLRGPLREWAEDLLSPASLAADGMLDPSPIRAMWQKHLSGTNVQHAIWNVLMYMAWRARWR